MLLACIFRRGEQELGAFLRAVTELFGEEQAELSAEDWMREAVTIDRFTASTREWRRIPLNVTARLSAWAARHR